MSSPQALSFPRGGGHAGWMVIHHAYSWIKLWISVAEEVQSLEFSRPDSATTGPSVLVTKASITSSLIPSLCFPLSSPFKNVEVHPAEVLPAEIHCGRNLVHIHSSSTEGLRFLREIMHCCHAQHSTDFHTEGPSSGLTRGRNISWAAFLSAKDVPLACK